MVGVSENEGLPSKSYLNGEDDENPIYVQTTLKQQVLAGISVILGEIDDFFYQNSSQPEIISNKNSPYPVKNRLALWVEFM